MVLPNLPGGNSFDRALTGRGVKIRGKMSGCIEVGEASAAPPWAFPRFRASALPAPLHVLCITSHCGPGWEGDLLLHHCT